MQIIDWILIGIIVIFAIVGLFKGLVKMLFSLCKGLVVFGLDYLLCKPITKLILKFNFCDSINEKLFNWISTKGEIFSQPLTEESVNAISEKLNLPSFLSDLVEKAINSCFGDLVSSGSSLGQAVADTLTYYLILVIVFLLLLLILFLLFKLINKLFDAIFSLPVLNTVNRLLGMLFGALFAILIIGVVFVGVDFVCTFVHKLSDIIDTYIDPTNPEFGFARWMYNNNPVRIIFNSLINGNNINWKSLIPEKIK